MLACRTPLTRALSGAAHGLRRASRTAARASAAPPRCEAAGARGVWPSATAQCRRSVAASASGGDSPSADGADVGPINKSVIVLTQRTYAYLLANTREPAALRACREATSGMHGSQMQVPPEQGALLGLLVELSGARRALEVGTYTARRAVSRSDHRFWAHAPLIRAGVLVDRHRAGAAGRRHAGDVRRERGDHGRGARNLGRSRRCKQGTRYAGVGRLLYSAPSR